MIKSFTLRFYFLDSVAALSLYLSGLKMSIDRICRARFLFAILSIVFHLLFTQNSFAEGSKDLYPSGAPGNRAFLYANVDARFLDRFPFKTTGTHFVYAKAGETIAVASSAIGYNNARIIVTSPNSSVPDTYNLGSGSMGRIPNRSAELLGPNWSGDPAAGYTPIIIPVNAATEGIWKVEFLAPIGRGSNNANDGGIPIADVAANGTWTQPTGNTSNYVVAWDVSVRGSSGWLKGRVYANVLNLTINGNFTTETKGFYGINYILTEDGRAYRVQANGNNGYAFTFFSNNNGFAVNGVPTYKSLNVVNTTGLHDPRTLDDALNKTHKIFYNKPNADLPETANAYVTDRNQTMWLKRNAILPIITNVKFIGVEGTEGKISRKGAKISFNSSTSGSFQIVIPVPGGVDRVINGAAVPGYNEIFWDGKDGNNAFLPPGAISPLVQTFLRSAEVHFPYIDMEVNPRGIIIELTENNTTYTVNPANTNPSEYSDKVYWNDVDIANAGTSSDSSNPVINITTGQHSNTNGHKFGSYNNRNESTQFGNDRSMDTWAYIESERTTQLVNIEISQADLRIESISPDLGQYFSDKKVIYTVRVYNDGPSAANGSRLEINLPSNLTIVNITESNATAGVVVTSPSTVGQIYKAVLDLPNKGIIDFKVEATFTGSYNNIFNAKASILRPADLTDPDATGNNNAGPVDADEECLNGAASGEGICNNIKYNTVNGQEICQGSNITPVVYTLSPDGTQFENTNPLPASLTTQTSGNNRTVSGVLPTSGIYNFFIKTLSTNRTQTSVTIRAIEQPNATADGPASLCVDATGNPVIIFKGSSTDRSYEFSYTVNGGPVQTITTPAGSDTATLPIPLTTSGDFTYRLTRVKDLGTGCSVVKNVAVTVTVHPLPARPNVQLFQ